ncbi:MAG TPA: YceI family protein [Blastocatellia bacterium]|nr:YceI family protein [Blastocatellia bacterium]HMV82881.1 YceI family protein [Blastocatellia bacterium]HMX26578.1 YceI family protein [Blastocatellia bacterium]HMY72193.1 YceI family protein [Blastocatellia bacterium]HMZ21738.1 YceI family protein [Blastocatellia bacterium]
MTHWLTVLLLLLTWDGFQSVPKPGQAKARPTKNQPRTFNFDAATSEINVTLTQEGLISRRYPTHRVVAKTFTGNIELPKDETKMAASLEAEAKAMTNEDAAMGDFERKEFHAALRNTVLEADKFPTIKFIAVSVSDLKKTGDRRTFTLNGDLTLHGVTRRVAFPVNADINATELRATGEAKLKQSDFGMKPFEKGLGLIKIGDELKVTFTVVAKAN